MRCKWKRVQLPKFANEDDTVTNNRKGVLRVFLKGQDKPKILTDISNLQKISLISCTFASRFEFKQMKTETLKLCSV